MSLSSLFRTSLHHQNLNHKPDNRLTSVIINNNNNNIRNYSPKSSVSFLNRNRIKPINYFTLHQQQQQQLQLQLQQHRYLHVKDLFSPRHKISAAQQQKRKKFQAISDGDIVLYALSLWITMFGLAYLSAPLYRALCQRYGWGGTVTRKIDKKMKSLRIWRESDDYRKNRKLLIRFDTRTGPGMSWEFTPVQNYVITRVGESTLAFFKAHNMAQTPMTGLSTYTVLPFKAAAYFIKIQCFCFEEQRLRGNEELDMPVLFFVDPAIVDDERCTDVHEVTLSYIFYPIVDEGDIDVEYEDYENDPFYTETVAEKEQTAAASDISSQSQLPLTPQLQM